MIRHQYNFRTDSNERDKTKALINLNIRVGESQILT